MEKHEAETMVYSILEQSRLAKNRCLHALDCAKQDPKKANEELQEAQEILFGLLPLEQALLFEQRNALDTSAFFVLYALQELENARLCYELVVRLAAENPDSI